MFLTNNHLYLQLFLIKADDFMVINNGVYQA
ncbi:hypothetical protein BB2000_2663 [Proteus mirabilis BB2000]|nr:hypothetical protein BB2000_2663 [Proteus mirabilis BB2000]